MNDDEDDKKQDEIPDRFLEAPKVYFGEELVYDPHEDEKEDKKTSDAHPGKDALKQIRQRWSKRR
jgi:hypothetical protein